MLSSPNIQPIPKTSGDSAIICASGSLSHHQRGLEQCFLIFTDQNRLKKAINSRSTASLLQTLKFATLTRSSNIACPAVTSPPSVSKHTQLVFCESDTLVLRWSETLSSTAGFTATVPGSSNGRVCRAEKQTLVERQSLEFGNLSRDDNTKKYEFAAFKSYNINEQLFYEWLILGLPGVSRQVFAGWAATQRVNDRLVGLPQLMNFLRFQEQISAVPASLAEKKDTYPDFETTLEHQTSKVAYAPSTGVDGCLHKRCLCINGVLGISRDVQEHLECVRRALTGMGQAVTHRAIQQLIFQHNCASRRRRMPPQGRIAGGLISPPVHMLLKSKRPCFPVTDASNEAVAAALAHYATESSSATPLLANLISLQKSSKRSSGERRTQCSVILRESVENI
ncbi:uncharacterized protein LOC113146749 [Cyclospora cayetanensis]|uniref:Uncharacterized protein LOC113146749 n=1 Tax=Cyclospora cayetanensis TaxID=88456 RepID=A0A6P6RTE4_9EIME|nr:uncharacterized protein LOC113146749 [Cyclospora cayetanensis]